MARYLDNFVEKIEKMQQKLAWLIQEVGQSPRPAIFLSEALAELSSILEEVYDLPEELVTQNTALWVSQNTLAVERQQYFELFNVAPDGYIVTNQKGIIEQINLTAATLVSHRQKECLGRPLAVLIEPADQRQFYTLLSGLKQGKALQNIVLFLRPSEGPSFSANFTVTVVRDYQSRIVGFRWLFRDMTAQHQAESALRKSEQRYATLAAAMPVGIFRTDKAGNYLYVNEHWCKIAGLIPEAAVGKGWQQGIHPDDRDLAVSQWYKSTQENKPFQLEYRFQRPDGLVTWVYGQSAPECDPEGQTIGYVGTITDISELKQAQELITHNALHDPLTDLPNRALLLERLKHTLNKAKRNQKFRYAVFFLDLDRFKLINDSLGHAVGDQLLKAIAKTLKMHLREIDLVARLGGDEFVILLEDSCYEGEVIQIAERILADCKRPFRIDQHEIFTSFSIGIVLGSPSYHQASDLLRDADIAMYRAKLKGKNAYQFFDVSMHQQVQTRLSLETDLRKALEKEEFIVYYQPIFEVRGRHLVGFEALVRWQHPTRGCIMPDEFVPIAEEMGLIVQLDNWVFGQACQQMSRWQNQYADCFPLKISINFSAQDLSNPLAIKTIDDILVQTGLAGDAIILEITERMLIEDVEKTVEVLTHIASRNIQISIDDFGTGYSSLNYLHRLPVHALKIDGSFVSQMQVENRNYEVVNTIIALGKQLGLNVVAEGIETQQQLQQLQQLGCNLGQGYLFSNPLMVADIEAHFLTVKTKSASELALATLKQS